MIPQVVMNGIIAGGSYVLVSVGFCLIFRSYRFFHIAHGIAYTAAAYVAYAANAWLRLPLALSVMLGIAAAVVTELAVAMGIYRPLQHRGASSLVMFVASLGALVFVQNGIALAFGDSTVAFRSVYTSTRVAMFDTFITKGQLLQLGAGLVLTAALVMWLRGSSWGLQVLAYGDDPELAVVRGVSADSVQIGCIVIGSILAGIGGVLNGLDTDLSPSMGFNAILVAIVAMIAGGTGNLLGSMLGAFMVGSLRHLGSWVLPTEWQDIVTFALLAGCLLLRPEGLLGRRSGTMAT